MARINEDSKYGSLSGNSKGNLWSSAYDSWKEDKKTGMFFASGNVGSTFPSSSNSSSSSSSSSNTLVWDKVVNDVFKERKYKK